MGAANRAEELSSLIPRQLKVKLENGLAAWQQAARDLVNLRADGAAKSVKGLHHFVPLGERNIRLELFGNRQRVSCKLLARNVVECPKAPRPSQPLSLVRVDDHVELLTNRHRTHRWRKTQGPWRLVGC